MRTHLIILLVPLLNQYLRRHQIHEYLPVNKLIPQLAIERLYVSILPGTAWFYEQALNPDSV